MGFASLGIFISLVIWQALSAILGPVRLPSPITSLSTFAVLPFHSQRLAAAGLGGEGGIAASLVYTFSMCLVGIGIGAFAGVLIGLTMSRSQVLRNLLEPPIEFARAVPPLVLVPFLGMWMGPGMAAQIILVGVYVGLMTLITTINAVDHLKPVYARFSSTLGATQQQVFRTVTVPAVIPEIVGGLRVSIGVAWGLQVIAELVGSQYGVGIAILMMVPRMMTAEIIATVLWVALIAFIFDVLFLAIVNRLTSWKPREAS